MPLCAMGSGTDIPRRYSCSCHGVECGRGVELHLRKALQDAMLHVEIRLDGADLSRCCQDHIVPDDLSRLVVSNKI